MAKQSVKKAVVKKPSPKMREIDLVAVEVAKHAGELAKLQESFMTTAKVVTNLVTGAYVYDTPSGKPANDLGALQDVFDRATSVTQSRNSLIEAVNDRITHTQEIIVGRARANQSLIITSDGLSMPFVLLLDLHSIHNKLHTKWSFGELTEAELMIERCRKQLHDLPD